MSEVLDRRDKVTFVKGVLPASAGVQKLNRFARAVFRNGEGMITRRFSKFCVGKSGQYYFRRSMETKIGQVLLTDGEFKRGFKNPS